MVLKGKWGFLEEMWHPWLDEFRTFLSSKEIQLKLKKLQVLLI